MPRNNSMIAQLSCDRETFDNAIPPYAEALKKAEHTWYPMSSMASPNRKTLEKRNITWLNIQYNINVKVNIGK